MSRHGSRNRPLRRVTSGPVARIATSDVVVAKSESNMLPKRSSIAGRVRSAHLSIDLDNAEWQQRIMKAWPKKCTFVVREIFQTERTYIVSLEEIILGYMLPVHGYLLSQQEGPQFIHTVFSNIIKLEQLHGTLLTKLHAVCGDPHEFATVFIETDFSQYRVYCTNVPRAQQYLQETLQNNEKLRNFIVHCQHDLEHSLPLHSHLIKPVQRILKYKLLLEEVLKEFDMEDVAYSDIKEALQKMKNVAEEINTSFKQTKEETAVSPATIAHMRSKEIKYLQTRRRVDHQRRTTLSDSPGEELQRSLEFEDSLSLLRSARSSSMQHKKGESSARPPPPNTLGVSREPTTPIDDIIRLIEGATPTEELLRSQEFEDSMSLLRSKCTSIAQQKRMGRQTAARTVGSGRKPRMPITDIVGLFDTVKPAEASSNASSASSSTPMSPSVAPSPSSATQPFHLLPPKPRVEQHVKTDEHSSTTAGEALLATEVPNSPAKKEPILPTKALPRTPAMKKSPSSARKVAASLNEEKEPILPNKQRNFVSQPKEQGVSRKFPLLPNKEKIENFEKQSHPQPMEKERAPSGETANTVTPRKSISIPSRPLPPPSVRKQSHPQPMKKERTPSSETADTVTPRRKSISIPSRPLPPPSVGKQSHPQPMKKERTPSSETADTVTAKKPISIPSRPLPPPSVGVVKSEKPFIPKKPLLPDKKLPQKKAPPQNSHRQWNHHPPGFPTKFMIDETTDGGPTVSLPPLPLPNSPPSKTFFPSMLKPVQNSAVRDSVFVRQNSVVDELKHVDRQAPLESFTQGKRAQKQSSIRRTEGGGEARKTPLLPPANHRDLPASAHDKLQATN